jgi:RecA/RadA recombinase
MAFDPKSLELILEATKKKYKDKGVISNALSTPEHRYISYKDIQLDRLTGGGVCMGKLTALEAMYSGGKSTILLESAAVVLQAYPEKIAYLIITEGDWDPEYAEHIIGEPFREGRIVVSQDNNAVKVLNIAIDLIKTGKVCFLGVDSWAMLSPPVEEKEGYSIGDHTVGGLAKISSEGLRPLTDECNRHEVAFYLTNQIRVNLTAMGARGKKPAGGDLLNFMPHVKLMIERPPGDKEGDLRQITVTKSKTAATPFIPVMVSIKKDLGVDRVGNLVEYCLDKETENSPVLAAGSWLSIPELDRKVQGKEKLISLIYEDQTVREYLCKAIGIEPFEPRPVLERKHKRILPEGFTEVEE